ncbi:MAG: hypothetical protein ARM1_0502 [Candidatus Micrarchaeota archaeon]|nr:MAG: hypothetical protein ARM1_0502 [Candidatus Micrarchaeota archaeon]
MQINSVERRLLYYSIAIIVSSVAAIASFITSNQLLFYIFFIIAFIFVILTYIANKDLEKVSKDESTKKRLSRKKS